ncbi:MAG: hypothetical protein M3O50_22115 [Myxococcota bacterium]|nr:hypothetical protein [Myxococcota bacterium]
MRGYQQPALRRQATDEQLAFRGLSRHRRTKLARAAQTTLLKADQWARGGAVLPELASALEGALKSAKAKAPRSA